MNVNAPIWPIAVQGLYIMNSKFQSTRINLGGGGDMPIWAKANIKEIYLRLVLFLLLHSITFLPIVLGGGTMDLQMFFLSLFSFFSSSFLTIGCKRQSILDSVWVGRWVGGGYYTVNQGPGTDNAPLFTFKHQIEKLNTKHILMD